MFRTHHTRPDGPTNGERRTVTSQFDPANGQSLSTDVVEAVAAVLDVDATTLTPLYDAIDPSALDQLFDATRADADRGPITISFRYEACAVTVRSNGRITVSAPNRDRQ